MGIINAFLTPTLKHMSHFRCLLHVELTVLLHKFPAGVFLLWDIPVTDLSIPVNNDFPVCEAWQNLTRQLGCLSFVLDVTQIASHPSYSFTPSELRAPCSPVCHLGHDHSFIQFGCLLAIHPGFCLVLRQSLLHSLDP